jgi:hypothetical protein
MIAFHSANQISCKKVARQIMYYLMATCFWFLKKNCINHQLLPTKDQADDWIRILTYTAFIVLYKALFDLARNFDH